MLVFPVENKEDLDAKFRHKYPLLQAPKFRDEPDFQQVLKHIKPFPFHLYSYVTK